jgi:hypothetical protein
MVRKGGRSNDIHMAMIKEKNTNRPMAVVVSANVFFSFHAAYAPVIHRSTAMRAK